MENRAGGLFFQHGFDADVEGDVVAEGFAEHGGAGEAELGFFDEAGDFSDAEAEEFDLERDGFGDVFKGEIAGDVVGVFAGFFPRGAFETGGGVLGDIEEVGALDVAVALFVGGVEGGDVDDGFDGAAAEIGAVDVDAAGDFGEAAGEFGDEMAEAEVQRRVHGIDDVGLGRRGGGADEAKREDGEEGELSDGFHGKKNLRSFDVQRFGARKSLRRMTQLLLRLLLRRIENVTQ